MGRVATDGGQRGGPHLNSCRSPEHCTSAPNSTGGPAVRGWGLSQRFFAHTAEPSAQCSQGDALATARAKGHKAVAGMSLELCLGFSGFCD